MFYCLDTRKTLENPKINIHIMTRGQSEFKIEVD